MGDAIRVRAVVEADYAAWRPLWDGYNRFYGRYDATALDDNITAQTWARFFAPAEPLAALVAEANGRVAGLAHIVFHCSTTRLEDVCYLQDLYTDETARGQGIGRALIEGVCAMAQAAGCRRVYWQTHESNQAGRALYDKLAQHKGFIVYSREW